MHNNANQPNSNLQLRAKAEEKLKSDMTTTSGHWSVGVDALRLLHRLSSDPDNAEDALKLLHELQVHQVELDLQNEEMAAHEQEMTRDLALYRECYDAAPLAYFLVDVEGHILQSNLAGTELFGTGPEELQGVPFDTLLLAKSRTLLHGLLQGVAQSGSRDSCIADTAGGRQASRPLRLLAATPPGREHILLVCCECESVE